MSKNYNWTPPSSWLAFYDQILRRCGLQRIPNADAPNPLQQITQGDNSNDSSGGQDAAANMQILLQNNNDLITTLREEAANWRSETANWRSETANWRSETANWRSQSERRERQLIEETTNWRSQSERREQQLMNLLMKAISDSQTKKQPTSTPFIPAPVLETATAPFVTSTISTPIVTSTIPGSSVATTAPPIPYQQAQTQTATFSGSFGGAGGRSLFGGGAKGKNTSFTGADKKTSEGIFGGGLKPQSGTSPFNATAVQAQNFKLLSSPPQPPLNESVLSSKAIDENRGEDESDNE